LDDVQERDIVRLLLEYYNADVEEEKATVIILANLADVKIQNPLFASIIEEFRENVDKGVYLEDRHFTNHENEDVRKLAIELIQSPYEISENWEKKHNVYITEKSLIVKTDIIKAVSLLKLKKMLKLKKEFQNKIKMIQNEGNWEDNFDEIMHHQKMLKQFDEVIHELSKQTGTVVLG
jgi:DNA primase